MDANSKPALMFDTNAFQGLGWSAHQLVHERFRVVLQQPLMHELAGKFVQGKPNSLGLPAEEHVAKLLEKFQGQYAFMSIAKTLCARELRGEKLQLNGVPYTQDHLDAFNENGELLGLMAQDDNGRPMPVPVYWINRVRNGKPARDPNEEPTPGPFDAQHVLGEAAGLLDRLGSASSNDELLSRVRAVLRDPDNALPLIRFTANASTPASHAKARSRLRVSARGRWLREGQPDFSAYPYCMHCAEVVFLYFGGVKCGKPREPDNDPGDLEHLKMLPFVSYLASDDRLVRTIGGLLARPEQRVLTKQQLLDELAEP